jgi:hypothetical protein
MLIATLTDLELALVVGIATAMGAGIGGVVAGVVSLRIDDRREERTAQREKETRRKSARVAARLVSDELREALTSIDQALKNGEWGLVRLPIDEWREHRTELAWILNYAAWLDVRTAVVYLDVLGRTSPGPSTQLDDVAQEMLEKGKPPIQRAMTALETLSQD